MGDVVSGSPAEEAGIRRGDVIVTFNNTAVKDSRDLASLVAQTPVGQQVTVIILRDGVERELFLTVGKLSSGTAKTEESRSPAHGKLGLLLQDVNPQMAGQRGLTANHGVVVVGVQPGSPADRAGIHKGDVILEVNHQPVNSVTEVKGAITKANDEGTLLLLVKRDRGSFFIALEKKA